MPLNCLGGISRNLSFPLFVSRTGFEESSSGKCYNSFNAGIAGMVPKGTSDEHSRSSLNPKGTQSSNKTRFSTKPSGGKQNATTSGVGSFREKPLAERLSKSAISLISDARRSGTVNHYESSWKKWDSWCNRQGFHPIRCDLNPILKFLTEILHQGLKYNTIYDYRSAISAYHDSIILFSVRKHSSLITWIFNNRMSQPRYFFIWDVIKILGFLNSLDSERIQLKMLTYKVTLLLDLTGSSRAHEICHLDFRYHTVLTIPFT